MKLKIILTAILIFGGATIINAQGVLGKKLQFGYTTSIHQAFTEDIKTIFGTDGVNLGHTIEFERFARGRTTRIFQISHMALFEYNKSDLMRINVEELRFGFRFYTHGYAPFGAFIEFLAKGFYSWVPKQDMGIIAVGGIFGTGIQWIINDDLFLKIGYTAALHYTFKPDSYTSELITYSNAYNPYIGFSKSIK